MKAKTRTLLPWAVSEEELEVERQRLQKGELRAVTVFLAVARRRKLRWAWRNMLTRCYCQHAPNFTRYGGRGIAVCLEWRNSFKVFTQWALSNGFYTDLTLDRRDNDGGYGPDNCRWVTMSENLKNRKVSAAFIAASRRSWATRGAKVLAASIAANSRPVIASNGATFPSTTAASQAFGLDDTAVWKCLRRGPNHKAAGLTWRYL